MHGCATRHMLVMPLMGPFNDSTLLIFHACIPPGWACTTSLSNACTGWPHDSHQRQVLRREAPGSWHIWPGQARVQSRGLKAVCGQVGPLKVAETCLHLEWQTQSTKSLYLLLTLTQHCFSGHVGRASWAVHSACHAGGGACARKGVGGEKTTRFRHRKIENGWERKGATGHMCVRMRVHVCIGVCVCPIHLCLLRAHKRWETSAPHLHPQYQAFRLFWNVPRLSATGRLRRSAPNRDPSLASVNSGTGTLMRNHSSDSVDHSMAALRERFACRCGGHDVCCMQTSREEAQPSTLPACVEAWV